MGRKRKSADESQKKRKKVTVRLLERKRTGKVTEPYRIMEELIAAHHSHLRDAKIAIAWRLGWSQNVDGRLRLGQTKKGSDLDRELHQFDFVIVLNHEAWNQGGLTPEQCRALVDHELCHCQVVVDTDGEPKQDEVGRIVYRIRKHDVEEFADVTNRHGLWTHELAELAKAGIAIGERPILSMLEKQEEQAKGTASA